MGLLDMLNSDDSRFALSLLAAAGPSQTPLSFGQRAMGAVQQFDQFRGQRDEAEARKKEREQRETLQRLQMEQAMMAAEAQQQAQKQRADYLASLETVDRGPSRPFSAVGALRAGLDPKEVGLLAPKAADSPFEKLNPKDYTPESLQAYLRTGDVSALRATAKPESAPSSVQEYQFARQQGYQGSYEQWVKEKARAGATNIGLPKIDIKMGEGIASQVGPMLKDSRAQAESGLRLVDSAGRVLQAAQSGNLFAGPLANLQLKSAQVMDALGIAGKTTQERIANTRSTIRGMAEQAVSARAQLGGQAQISNSEQELLNKATSGDVGELTAGEIVQIAKLNDRLGRMLYGNHQRQMEVLRKQPELSNVAPYYEVPPLPQGSQVKRYNPQTGRIE
jgi:hypothetical protein